MKKRLLGWFFVFGVMLGMPSVVFADSTGDEIAELRSRLQKLEERLDREQTSGIDRGQEKKSLDEIASALKGITIGGGATMIVQGVKDANGDGQLSKNEDVTDASYSVDLEFGKEFEQGHAFIHLETGDGAGVDDELKLFSSVNRDADDSDNAVSVTEAWYEHQPGKGPFKVAFGKLDPTSVVDNNAYANDEGAQFLGSMFRNSAVIEFPDNGLGARVSYDIGEKADIGLIAVDGDADGEDAGDGMFVGGQLNFKPRLLDRDGNYRLLAWSNGQNHTRWSDTEKNKENGYGYGLSFDQELTDVLGAFVRYGWQNPKVVLSTADDFDIATAAGLEQAYSLGLQLKGSLWGRAEDVTALAFGQVFPSDEYKNQDSTRKAKTENHLEWYYNWRVNDHFHLSPDLQVVWNPYGGDAVNGNDTILVGGLRAQVDF
ncbi:MAG: carbohydrate porin [Candidatus Omnitrophica bacterium]|nr:carbohydrate porin [Candidatus Omnitrophota bacterium]